MQDESDLEGNEGLIDREDLVSYEPVWREPLAGEYRGRGVLAMQPPTSGGIAVIEMLNVLEGFGLEAEGQASGETLHLLAEAQKLAFADRDAYVADPTSSTSPPAGSPTKHTPRAGRPRSIWKGPALTDPVTSERRSRPPARARTPKAALHTSR